MLKWLRNRRRRKVLAQPFPREWLRHIYHNVYHYQNLNEAQQTKLRDEVRVFIDGRYWEGAGGLEVTDEVKVTIAAHACLLTLGMKDENHYKSVRTIIVYPNVFSIPHRRQNPNGIVSEGGMNSGQAWFRGPIILAWAEALAGGRNLAQGRNVILHEFAHALDMLDGLVNGTPLLKDKKHYARWNRVMTEEYQQLLQHSAQGQPTLLDQYGATNVAEFFAVATECFFERGEFMKWHHPRLYEVLHAYYRQDTAAQQQRER